MVRQCKARNLHTLGHLLGERSVGKLVVLQQIPALRAVHEPVRRLHRLQLRPQSVARPHKRERRTIHRAHHKAPRRRCTLGHKAEQSEHRQGDSSQARPCDTVRQGSAQARTEARTLLFAHRLVGQPLPEHNPYRHTLRHKGRLGTLEKFRGFRLCTAARTQRLQARPLLV